MTKVNQNFEMWSGDHKNVTFTVTDNSGASVNLAGASVVWTLAEEPSTGSLVRKTSDSGISISGCTFTVSLSPDDTSGLAGMYYHESQVKDGDENVSTVAVGNCRINADLAV